MSSPHNNSDENRGRKRPLEPQQEERAASSLLSSSSAGGSPRTFERQNRNEPAAQTNSSNSNDNDDDKDNGNNDNRDPYGEGSDLFDAASMPNDTMATILALQTEFYRAERNSALDGGGCGGSGERTGVVLQHQIYTVLENRTAVDIELTAMRKENILRTFRLGTGREDWGIMSTEHYLRLISNLMGGATSSASSRGNSNSSSSDSCTTTSEKRRPAAAVSSSSATVAGKSTKSAAREQHASFARDVLEHLVLSNTNAYASRKQVSTAMREVLQEQDRKQDAADAADGKSGTDGGGGGGGGRGRGGAAVGEGSVAGEGGHRLASWGRAKGQQRIKKWGDEGDEQDLRSLKRNEEKVLSLISKLVQAGFLLPRRDVGREEAYWFSMPNLGKVVAAISRGRKDIVGALKRTRYKEMRHADVERKKLAKTTGLPLSFHVRDLVGLGMIRELDTPSGMFLRLPTDAR